MAHNTMDATLEPRAADKRHVTFGTRQTAGEDDGGVITTISGRLVPKSCFRRSEHGRTERNETEGKAVWTLAQSGTPECSGTAPHHQTSGGDGQLRTGEG
ncbi:hypothetical protein O3P69_013060 [Scylla paramamosain]|uniref:Uncharacterized protein n=1 Tax=Scylla paramamosain TaxID=85552 RepID=A0AAW0TU29_SCYPA